ncbi:MAG: alpha/beta hydrolase [Mycobacterium sp.]
MAPLTPADVKRWDLSAIRLVFQTAGSRSGTLQRLGENLQQVHDLLSDWQGEAGPAFRADLGKVRTDIQADGQESQRVATAVQNAEHDIAGCKAGLDDIEERAEENGWAITPDWRIDVGDTGIGRDPIEFAAQQQMLQADLDQLKVRAHSTDQELATAIRAAVGEVPLDAAGQPTNGRPQTPAPKLPDDPDQFTQAWNALSAAQKEAAYNENHFIGTHPGMPFEDKTLFNERHLDELTHNAQANVDGMQARYDQLARQQIEGDHSAATGNELAALGPRLQAARHSLAEFHGAQNAMKAPSGTPKRYLGYIDDKGHAAVSIGNPDTATRNCILVPGTGDDLTNMSDNTNRAAAMYNAAMQANPNLNKGDVSVTAWLGYDRPMSVLGQAPWPSYAEHGAGALDSFENGMRASHVGGPSIDTVVGHSYGTTLVGAAASDGHHLAANNVVAVASPGMLVDHAGDLSINPGGSVYAMTDPHDPIGPANLFTQLTLGPDPTGRDFGAHDLYAGTHLGIGPEHGFPSLDAHSGYWNANTPSLANLGAVIAGVPAPFPAGG